MKKLTAISFLLLLLFNLFGYQLLFYYAQQQSDLKLASALDKARYNEDDLITITVPISVPYQTGFTDFERVDGEITVNGKIYKYVKRKITEGHLVLMCLPDHNKMRLESAKVDFFKNANDFTQNNGSRNSEKSKTTCLKIVSEYEPSVVIQTTAGVHLIKINRSSIYMFTLVSTPQSSPGQPPELV